MRPALATSWGRWRVLGLSARHITGDIYEIRANGDRQTFRILFAREGKAGQILLALHGFSKKQQKLEHRHLALATQRLADWRDRGRR